ncbi:hypothetical protein THAOC_09495 [Thalassiosira oceanica]|uniref:Uncharacterized protein n=1 Tax=Thalassiosira oceanica TaxID=159749 RepID=K0SV16_THAOC|nr:hypothetical protein THAOC_09495 [Thalassiosira oceanica]|eukprot:EJK69260.1 hypothetical protein THAOC_09495 [Thalassiosira oceanica]
MTAMPWMKKTLGGGAKSIDPPMTTPPSPVRGVKSVKDVIKGFTRRKIKKNPSSIAITSEYLSYEEPLRSCSRSHNDSLMTAQTLASSYTSIDSSHYSRKSWNENENISEPASLDCNCSYHTYHGVDAICGDGRPGQPSSLDHSAHSLKSWKENGNRSERSSLDHSCRSYSCVLDAIWSDSRLGRPTSLDNSARTASGALETNFNKGRTFGAAHSSRPCRKVANVMVDNSTSYGMKPADFATVDAYDEYLRGSITSADSDELIVGWPQGEDTSSSKYEVDNSFDPELVEMAPPTLDRSDEGTLERSRERRGSQRNISRHPERSRRDDLVEKKNVLMDLHRPGQSTLSRRFPADENEEEKDTTRSSVDRSSSQSSEPLHPLCRRNSRTRSIRRRSRSRSAKSPSRRKSSLSLDRKSLNYSRASQGSSSSFLPRTPAASLRTPGQRSSVSRTPRIRGTRTPFTPRKSTTLATEGVNLLSAFNAGHPGQPVGEHPSNASNRVDDGTRQRRESCWDRLVRGRNEFILPEMPNDEIARDNNLFHAIREGLLRTQRVQVDWTWKHVKDLIVSAVEFHPGEVFPCSRLTLDAIVSRAKWLDRSQLEDGFHVVSGWQLRQFKNSQHYIKFMRDGVAVADRGRVPFNGSENGTVECAVIAKRFNVNICIWQQMFGGYKLYRRHHGNDILTSKTINLLFSNGSYKLMQVNDSPSEDMFRIRFQPPATGVGNDWQIERFYAGANSPIGGALRAYASHHAGHAGRLMFTYRGTIVLPDTTPAGLDIGRDDEIIQVSLYSDSDGGSHSPVSPLTFEGNICDQCGRLAARLEICQGCQRRACNPSEGVGCIAPTDEGSDSDHDTICRVCCVYRASIPYFADHEDDSGARCTIVGRAYKEGRDERHCIYVTKQENSRTVIEKIVIRSDTKVVNRIKKYKTHLTVRTVDGTVGGRVSLFAYKRTNDGTRVRKDRNSPIVLIRETGPGQQVREKLHEADSRDRMWYRSSDEVKTHVLVDLRKDKLSYFELNFDCKNCVEYGALNMFAFGQNNHPI